MDVAHGDAQGVAGVARQHLMHPKEKADHVLNLGFFGAALADQSLLDLTGGVFEDRQPGIHGGADGGAPGLSQFQGGVGVLGHEHLFDGHLRGPMLAGHLGNAVINLFQPQGQIVAFRADDAVGHQHRALDAVMDDAVAGAARAGIDAKNADQSGPRDHRRAARGPP